MFFLLRKSGSPVGEVIQLRFGAAVTLLLSVRSALLMACGADAQHRRVARMGKYEWQASNSAPAGCPMELNWGGFLLAGDGEQYIPAKDDLLPPSAGRAARVLVRHARAGHRTRRAALRRPHREFRAPRAHHDLRVGRGAKRLPGATLSRRLGRHAGGSGKSGCRQPSILRGRASDRVHGRQCRRLRRRPTD
jgi:hypothetical protein